MQLNLPFCEYAAFLFTAHIRCACALICVFLSYDNAQVLVVDVYVVCTSACMDRSLCLI